MTVPTRLKRIDIRPSEATQQAAREIIKMIAFITSVCLGTLAVAMLLCEAPMLTMSVGAILLIIYAIWAAFFPTKKN